MSQPPEQQRQPENVDKKPKEAGKQPDWKAKGAELFGAAEQQLKDVGKSFEDEFADMKADKTKEFLGKQGIDEHNLVDYLKTQTLDATIAHPTNAQIVQAVKDWQEVQGLKVDGVIGPKTFAKMKKVPDLMVALKKEKSVLARAAEGQDSKDARQYEVNIDKGTMYRFKDASGKTIRRFFGENTPAIKMGESRADISVQLADEKVVQIPKYMGAKEAEGVTRAQYVDSTKERKTSSAAAATPEKKDDAFDAMSKLQKSKKSFGG